LLKKDDTERITSLVKKQIEEDRQTLAQARRDAAREAAEQPGQEDDDREP